MPVNFTANDVLQNAILQNLDQVQVDSNQLNPGRYPRPMVSTIDTFDQHTQLDYHTNAVMPQYRTGWNTPSIAVTNETVNTVRSSVATKFVSPSVPSPQMYADVSTSSTSYKPVPNMAQKLYVDSQVQISFSLLISTAQATSPAFAIFRDSVKISQDYHQLTGGSGVQSLVSATYVDTNPTLLKYHVYDLRWKATNPQTTGPVTAVGKNRTFQASNLRAL